MLRTFTEMRMETRIELNTTHNFDNKIATNSAIPLRMKQNQQQQKRKKEISTAWMDAIISNNIYEKFIRRRMRCEPKAELISMKWRKSHWNTNDELAKVCSLSLGACVQRVPKDLYEQTKQMKMSSSVSQRIANPWWLCYLFNNLMCNRVNYRSVTATVRNVRSMELRCTKDHLLPVRL